MRQRQSASSDLLRRRQSGSDCKDFSSRKMKSFVLRNSKMRNGRDRDFLDCRKNAQDLTKKKLMMSMLTKSSGKSMLRTKLTEMLRKCD